MKPERLTPDEVQWELSAIPFKRPRERLEGHIAALEEELSVSQRGWVASETARIETMTTQATARGSQE